MDLYIFVTLRAHIKSKQDAAEKDFDADGVSISKNPNQWDVKLQKELDRLSMYNICCLATEWTAAIVYGISMYFTYASRSLILAYILAHFEVGVIAVRVIWVFLEFLQLQRIAAYQRNSSSKAPMPTTVKHGTRISRVFRQSLDNPNLKIGMPPSVAENHPQLMETRIIQE